jgi:hypothetical protein
MYGGNLPDLMSKINRPILLMPVAVRKTSYLLDFSSYQSIFFSFRVILNLINLILSY